MYKISGCYTITPLKIVSSLKLENRKKKNRKNRIDLTKHVVKPFDISFKNFS